MGSFFARNSTTPLFDCAICIESLDAPASISDIVQENNPVNPAVGPARGHGNRGGGRGGGGRTNNTPTNLKDVVATHCGHLYHKVCLETWFNGEEGRRSCPSCCQDVPRTKMFKLYPSSSQNRGNGGGSCAKRECREMKMTHYELKMTHRDLKEEHTKLQVEYDALSSYDEVQEYMISALEEDNARKDKEIQLLKRKLRGHWVGSTPVGTALGGKRRRLK